MSDEHDLVRPRATPAQPRRRPSFAQPRPTGATHPVDQLAPDLEPPWNKEDTDTPDRTATYTHPDGHRIGLRLQGSDLIIQTWITAGPELPPIPDGTDIEQAEAQAANDARLQPGRTWHTTVATRHVDDLPATVASVVRNHLMLALTNKPKKVRLTSDDKADPGTNTPDNQRPTTDSKETER
ncbi:hypothetical protein [Streptomyces sp. TRM68367]|uniref:hypothetical protein n=1 Tax=Streptomyces sp. TRM68367 TaxID=2758415 RepID=UPI00165B1132|nr:hypothetical protein [Streptomyces sp. TRM68367]MBC9724923.1 hypothetical protein [Streptomyces sp. TRM68367]